MQRHELDVVSLASGLVFVAVAALVMSSRADLLTAGRWVIPALIIAVALVLLATAVRRRG